MLTSVDIQKLSDEERARHLTEFDAALEASTERMRLESEVKAVQITELEKLLAQRRQLLEKARQTLAEVEEQDARIARDVERVLAKAA